MSNKLKIALGSTALLLTGFLIYLKVQANKLLNITYRFQNFKVVNAGISDFRFTTDLVVTNPSDLTFTITDYDLVIQVEETPVANIKGSNLNFVVRKNQSVPLPLDVQFDPRKLAANLLSVFVAAVTVNARKGAVKVRTIGTISVKYGVFGLKNLPIDYTYEP
jgi:ribosomal protein L1